MVQTGFAIGFYLTLLVLIKTYPNNIYYDFSHCKDTLALLQPQSPRIGIFQSISSQDVGKTDTKPCLLLQKRLLAFSGNHAWILEEVHKVFDKIFNRSSLNY